MTTSPQHWLADGPEFRADRYFRYGDMAALLQNWATDYPEPCEVTSAGETWEGRTIRAVTPSFFARYNSTTRKRCHESSGACQVR